MTSASVTTSASTSLPAVPAVSPPSPRPRMELALTPGGPNGDSSRSPHFADLYNFEFAVLHPAYLRRSYQLLISY